MTETQIRVDSITLDEEGRIVVLDPTLLDEIAGANLKDGAETMGFIDIKCTNMNCDGVCGKE